MAKGKQTKDVNVWRVIMAASRRERVDRHNSYTFTDAQVLASFRWALTVGALCGGIVVLAVHDFLH